MKLNRDRFFQETKKKIDSIYSFFADESIQITELSDHVIKLVKAEGFEEKQTFIVSKDTDWSFLETSNENFDLFGAKKIIEVKMIGTGPGNKGSKAIKKYCSQPDENKLLIFSLSSLAINCFAIKSVLKQLIFFFLKRFKIDVFPDPIPPVKPIIFIFLLNNLLF